MKKADFVTLVMSVVGVLVLGVGMCMALLPEWDAFVPGVVLGAVGVAVLVAMVFVRRRMTNAPAIKLNGKVIGTVIFGVLAALVFGAGMCLVMVWELMLPGILVGIVGIVLLLCLIPMTKGLK